MQDTGTPSVDGLGDAVLGPPPTEYVSRLDAMTLEESETTGSSLGRRIFQSWRDMRGHTRGLIEEGLSEHRLLFYVMLSDIIFFVSLAIRTVVAPSAAAKSMVDGVEIGKYLIIALFVRTACMYVFSFILNIAARSFGGTGSWRETRTGVFWGALVAAPFGLLLAMISGLIKWYEPSFPFLGSDWISLPVLFIGVVPFIWFTTQGLAEAQGYSRNLVAFGILTVLTVVGFYGGTFLKSAGIL